ncbi:MAG TPA: GAF domain-containing protein [Candidatus Thermoplasmatota archaeon]|nr:GAF domain-containing protein [Candidatus Thermoplasmatota archaeon]
MDNEGESMQKPSLPVNEPARLAALRAYRILDTPSEHAFDDLAYLASQICGAPMALVSFVDADRQWWKARIGMPDEGTPRDESFCGHAILKPHEVLVVPDAARDARFADNPLVIGPLRVRFYAGAPIATSDGDALGTVCVLDRQPRTFTRAQEESLRAIARRAVSELELRRTIHDLEAMLDELRARDGLSRDPPARPPSSWGKGEATEGTVSLLESPIGPTGGYAVQERVMESRVLEIMRRLQLLQKPAAEAAKTQ